MIRQLRWIVLALFIGAMVGPNLLTALADGDTPQTITFTSTAPTHGDIGDSYSPTATASSDLTVALTIDSSSASVCSISDSTVTLSTIGTCTIDANQAGNDTYEAATQVQQSFDVYPTYSSAVLATDPSAYWPLSDTGGDTAADASGHDHPGTLADGVTEGGSSMPESSEPSMAFDGSGGISTTLVQPSVTKATYGAWINTSAGSGPVISGRDDVDTIDGNLTLDVGMFNSGSGLAEFGLNTAYSAYMKQSTIEVDTGDWVFVVGTFSTASSEGISTADMRIYIDGSLATGSDVYSGGGATAPLAGTGDIYIGEEAWSPAYFDGNMADAFVIYGTALSASQISALYEGELTQSIAFTSAAPADAAVDSTYTPAATSTSGLPVTLTIDSASSSVCSMSAGVVTFNAVGICLIDGNQAGESGYAAAPQAQQAVADYSDAEAILALGPSAFWPLSDTDTSTAVDYSGAVDTGNLQGGVSEDSTPGIPDIDSVPVMSFNGSGSYISTSNSLTIPDTVSEAVWFKTSSANGGLFSFISTQTGTPSSDWDEQMYVGSNGDLDFGVGTMIGTSSAVDDGQWHLAVGTLSPTSMSLYLDGSLVGTTTSAGSPPPYAGYWRVGEVDGAYWTNTDGNMDPFTGDLADAALFPTVLTAGQVSALSAGLEWQSVSFTSTVPASAEVGSTYAPTATASSGLTVSITVDSSSSSICSISDGVVTFNAAGTCLLDATQGGNSSYYVAHEVHQIVLVGSIFGLSPTAFWPLSDTGGTTAADLSGSDDFGSLQGGVTEDVSAGSGGPSPVQVMGFDGSTGYISTASSVEGPDVYSIAGWFKTTSDNGGIIIQFGQDQTGTGGGYDRQLYVGTDGNLYFGEYCGGATVLATSAPVDTGQWDYAVGVSTGSTMKLYLNGILVASNDFSECYDAAGYWRIGGGGLSGWTNEGSSWFDGDLAEVAVFPSALTTGQVRALYAVADGDVQTISFTSAAPLDKAVDDTYTPTATSTSGLTVTFSIDSTSTSVCSIADGIVTFNASGTCVIDANQGGNSTYLRAAQVQQIVTDQAYAEAVLSLDPSAFWPLSDPGGGTAIDLTGGGDTGNLHGGVAQDVTPDLPAYSSTPAAGFDGSTGYITTTTQYDNPTVYTIAGWFSTTASNGGMIIQFVGTDGYDRELYVGTDGDLYFGQCCNGLTTIHTSSPVNNGEWYYAVGVSTGSTMALYLNGALVGSNDNSESQDLTGSWIIGGGGYNGSWANVGAAWFDGSLADVAVFNYALTADEVSSLFVSLGTTQTISFTGGPPADPAPGNTYSLSATATSGDPVSLTDITSDVCTFESGLISLIASGTCTIDAAQGGDSTYAAATADQSFSVLDMALASSNYGPFNSDTVELTATAPTLGTITISDAYDGDTSYTCHNTARCSESFGGPSSSASEEYTATWSESSGGGYISTTTNVYWNAKPVVSTTMFDASDGVYINPFASQPTDQYCSDDDGSSSPTCTTATFKATDLNTGQSVTATDSDGDLSGSIAYPALDYYYGPETYTVTETADGETGTSSRAVVNSPLSYWTGSVAALFFLDNEIPLGSESYTYETMSDSPIGTPYIYSGEDQDNSGTCEATEDEGSVYCGQYATSAVLYLQLWTSDGDYLGYTPTGGFSGPADLALFLEEVGRGDPGIAARTLFGCGCGDPVNPESGDLYESYTDINVPGRGMNLNVTRSYNSLNADISGPFGYGWTSSLGMALWETDDDTVVTISDETGSQVTFTLNGDTWAAPAFNSSTLTESDGTWTYTRWDGDTFAFNSSGEITSESDRNGNTTSFAYTDGELTSVTDASGRSLTLTWDDGYITEITDPADQTVSYSYNGSGDLVEVTNQAGGHTYYTYDDSNDLLTVEDPDGNTTTNTYNDSGQVLTQTDPMSHETTFAYSAPESNETTTLVTDPDGNKTYFVYVDGLLMDETKAYGTDEAALTTYSYDPVTLGIATETDPDNDTTSYTYDQSGNILTETDPDGNTTFYTYNSLNEPLTITNAAGVTTTNTYDGEGNLLSTSTPLVGTDDSQEKTYSYSDDDQPGLPASVTDPDGDTTAYTYDSYGDLASSTNAAGDETTYTYNDLGEKLTMVSPKGNVTDGDPSDYTTTYTYDPLGDLLTTTDPDGNETVNTYDADGNLVSTTQPSGDETVTTYNADGEPTEVQSKDSGGTALRTTHTGYDDDGNVTSTTDGNGNETTYDYNDLNQKTSSTSALSETTSYTYDGDGNLLTETEPNGDVVTNTYDSDGLLVSTSYSDSTPDVSYSYDALGQKTSMTDGTGTSSWTYNSLGEETSYTNGAGAEVQYGYDLAGNETSITYPGGDAVAQVLNDANEISSITDWNDNESTFSYDANGNLTAEDLANGDTNSYTYDAANNLASISDTKGETSIFSATYTRNADSLVSEDSSQPSDS
ncbi:MAG: LamG-like jellyroll fold domain-containing protein, partial [Candidatus Dormiibacterota bacterium]